MLTNPFSTKTQDVSTIDADEVNSCGVQLTQALDMVGGGSYAQGADIAITGNKKFTWSSTGHFTFDNSVYVASRSETRSIETTPTYDPTKWAISEADGIASNTLFAGGPFILYPLDLPHGQTLTSVTVYYTGPGGHAAFPGGAPTLPTAVVEYIDTTGGGATVASQVDTSATVAVYEAIHPIVVNCGGHAIVRSSRRYYVKISAEAGANGINGGIIYLLTRTVTRTTIGED